MLEDMGEGAKGVQVSANRVGVEGNKDDVCITAGTILRLNNLTSLLKISFHV